MEPEIACSRCLYWDLEHVQQSQLDEDGVPIPEYFARCLNPRSLYHDKHTESQDGCGAFTHPGQARAPGGSQPAKEKG